MTSPAAALSKANLVSLYRGLVAQDTFNVYVGEEAVFGDLSKSLAPTGTEVLSTLVGKNNERNKTSRELAGYCSTQQKDRLRENLLQRGLDFRECVEVGWFNDNHVQSTAYILGFPVVVELHQHPEFGVRWFCRGYLLEGKNLEHIDRVWGTALALRSLERRLSFSVEGHIIERRGPIIVRAIIRNIAITAYPVNTDCTWDVVIDAMQGTESFVKSLTMPLQRALGGDGIFMGQAGVGCNQEESWICRDCGAIYLRDDQYRQHLSSTGHQDSRIERGGSKDTISIVTPDQAIRILQETYPQYTPDVIRGLVDIILDPMYNELVGSYSTR